MRFYSFTNANYMSQLQLGLQTAHCVAELMVKDEPSMHMQMFKNEWATDHKTIVILNGGNCAMLNDLYYFLSDDDNPYPYAKFNEDEQSLNNAITCVGIVLPEELYETARLVRSRIFYCPDSTSSRMGFNTTNNLEEDLRLGQLCRFYNESGRWTREFIGRLNSCGLA